MPRSFVRVLSAQDFGKKLLIGWSFDMARVRATRDWLFGFWNNSAKLDSRSAYCAIVPFLFDTTFSYPGLDE